jgi:hypothetical protein
MSRRISTLAMLSVCLAAWTAGHVSVGAYALTGARWGSNQMQYYVNPQSADLSPDEVVASVRRAADVWNTQSEANIVLEYAGTTTGSSATLNYKNEVFFRNEASGNTAVTYWWYSSGALLDADIIFYDGHQWFSSGVGCSNGYYVENTGAHEFGHALGLGHSEFDSATMWGSTYGCMTEKQTLSADDIAAVELVYPPAGGSGSSPSAAPAVPAQLTAAPAETNPSSSLALAWIASAGSDGYRIERSRDGVSFTEIRQVGGGTTTYTDTGLSASTSYQYRVKAFNGAGSSGYSNLAIATTLAPVTSSSPKGKGGAKRK